MKIWDQEADILRDVAREAAKRRFPPPGTSVVYDRVYSELAGAGLIIWVQVYTVCQSMSEDHYMLTHKGEAARARLLSEFLPIEVES